MSSTSYGIHSFTLLPKETKTRSEIIIDYAHELVGSGLNHNVEDELEELGVDNMTLADHQLINDVVFCCVICNWWCSKDECIDYHDQWTCEDCVEELGGVEE